MLFRSPWSLKVKIFSIVAVLFFFFLILLLFWIDLGSLRLVLILTLLGLIGFSFLFSPSGYLIKHNNLYIITRIKKFKIPISKIKAVREIEKKEFLKSLRIFGIGGLFGYTGIFYSENSGFFFSFATDYNNLILIESTKKYLISPENVDSFLSAIKKD